MNTKTIEEPVALLETTAGRVSVAHLDMIIRLNMKHGLPDVEGKRLKLALDLSDWLRARNAGQKSGTTAPAKSG